MDLVGVAEVAAMLGVSRQYVDRLARTDPTFPQPEAVITAGRIWNRNDIETWARRNGRITE